MTVAPRPAGPGAALALGGLAAAIAALPDVRRVAEPGVSPGLAWAALTGSTALVLGPLLMLVRGPRVASPTVRAVLVGAALAAAPVAWLGQSLMLHTHHRPLGAATFAALALVLVLGAVLVSVRTFAWVAKDPTQLRRWLGRVLTLAACAGLGMVVVRALSSTAFNHDVLDVCRVLAVLALAGRALDLPLVASLARRAGALSWVLLVLVGLVTTRGPVKAAIHARAPVMGGPAAWL